MAYDGGYQAPQRPYNGPAAPRPQPQRQYPDQYGPPQQQHQHSQYGEDYGYGYDQYGGNGYDQGYGGQYDDAAQQPPPSQQYPPQRDYYGPGPGGPAPRGSPMPGGRGGPMQRPPDGDGPRRPYPGPAGPGRGYPPNGPPGQGRPGPLDRAGTSDPSMNRSRPPVGDPRSPVDAGFGGSSFPALPGQRRKTDLDQEHQLLDRMGSMDIAGKRQGPPVRGQGAPRPPMAHPGDDYGRPPMEGWGPPPRGYPPQGPQGYPDQRRGPGPNRYGDYQDESYGAPARTMTMPTNPPMGVRDMPPPPLRGDSAPYNGPIGPIGRGMPPRPSTAQSSRPPPQRMYPPSQGLPGPQDGQYQGQDYDYNSVDSGYGPSVQPPRPASYDNYHDAYYEGGQPADYQRMRASDPPDFEAAALVGRTSFDQSLQAAPVVEQGQRGPGRLPEISRTKSQPDLRQPQAAVFEMAGDIPPVPSLSSAQGYPGQRPYGQPPPSGPTPPHGGLPSNPAAARAGPQRASPQGSGHPDALPSHPTPVRPGLMPNSLVSQMGSKPAPVRNYGGTPPSAGNAALPPAQGGPPAPRAAEAQTPVTSDELERLRTMVKAAPQDQESALRLAKKLIEASDVLVPNVADPKTRGRARERYLVDAHKVLKKLASANNTDAMFVLADSLGRGLFGGEPDNKEAFTLYQSAAKLGHAPAAYRTAVCCEIGNEEGGGTRKDPLKAIQWYKRAATLGDTPAMYKVGMILLKGLLGQPKNPREAVSWLKRASERADTENPHALHELGLLYESAQPNDVIIRDEAYAFTLFRQAAELGYKFSQFRLGCAYEYGLMGCPIDPRLSIMWYSKAAQQGEHQSELALSGWYLTGSEGVMGQNDTEAYLWARKAAMAGLAKAEYAMGYFTEVGIGVPANLEDAKRWYWRAAAQDFPKARERLEELKRTGKSGPRPRERISRSKIGKQQEGECVVM